ncbi:MAG: hypothetical protein E6K82_02150 [Candidatus Rokuibacteriota bacterium]|nr:MAG: hypothetical protein E6K82_02150 [Candidatus Rokubacteria bacterium]
MPPARRAGQAIEAEARLLALARELTELPAEATLADVVGRLGGAHGPDAPLPRALAQAWLRGRNDKTAALALAWAREQVRLALEERLIRAPARGAVAADPATRAWLLLAAAESIAHEPPAAAADRLRALLELTGHAPTPV